MKDMAEVQLGLGELAQKERDSTRKQAIDFLSERMKFIMKQMDVADHAAERASRERVERSKQESERMQLAQGALIHSDSIEAAEAFAMRFPGLAQKTDGGRSGRLL
jgi:hypothetical protein